jgi:preprotein translocase subunit SecG
MTTLLTIIHITACITLILIVLLQAGKGANMGAAFGGSSQTVFGSSGAGTFLGKVTAAVAIVFMLTSISLTYTASRKVSGLMDRAPAPVEQEAAPTGAELPAGLDIPPGATTATPATSDEAAK